MRLWPNQGSRAAGCRRPAGTWPLDALWTLCLTGFSAAYLEHYELRIDDPASLGFASPERAWQEEAMAAGKQSVALTGRLSIPAALGPAALAPAARGPAALGLGGCDRTPPAP
jgi:hypothetical protein